MADLLFSVVEKFHGAGRSWGRFLDAGTGVNSLKWIQTLPTTSWTAITADQNMLNSILSDPVIKKRECDEFLVGNWMDDKFCNSLGKYDTILADYLIGAVDGFSPYEQDVIINKMKNYLNPSGRLYIIGMNPIPDHEPSPADLVGEVRRARDACILLAGHRPYREFPLTWMTRHLENSGYIVHKERTLTILHSESSILRQINVAKSKLQYMKRPSDSYALKIGMEQYLLDLEKRVKAAVKSTSSGRIPLSFDYVIEAEWNPIITTNTTNTTTDTTTDTTMITDIYSDITTNTTTDATMTGAITSNTLKDSTTTQLNSVSESDIVVNISELNDMDIQNEMSSFLNTNDTTIHKKDIS